jgi:hypothetical protein
VCCLRYAPSVRFQALALGFSVPGLGFPALVLGVFVCSFAKEPVAAHVNSRDEVVERHADAEIADPGRAPLGLEREVEHPLHHAEVTLRPRRLASVLERADRGAEIPRLDVRFSDLEEPTPIAIHGTPTVGAADRAAIAGLTDIAAANY